MLHAVPKNNMWASHGLDRFCVRPYSVIRTELQVSATKPLRRNSDADQQPEPE
jgi:hypothetical protein